MRNVIAVRDIRRLERHYTFAFYELIPAGCSTMESTQKKSTKIVSSIESLEARIAPATITVVNLKDDGPGSLRDAIEEANATEGPDEIVFAKKVAGVVKVKSDLPAITDSVTISGPGASKLTLNGQKHQLISIVGDGLDVDISGLKLTGGEAANGGAVYINNPNGTVTLSKTVITKNRAIGSTEPGAEPYSSISVKGFGGGIAVAAGVVTIEKSKITGNKAGTLVELYVYGGGGPLKFFPEGSGGGVSVGSLGVVNLSKTVISGNGAGFGGGIHNAGQVSVTERSVISKNIASGFYELGANNSIHSGAKGGGVFNAGGALLTVSDSKITGNRAVGDKGIAGFYGEAPGSGGAAFGGGVFNAANGVVSIISSQISGNKAIGGKGGTGGLGEIGEDAGEYSRRGGRGGIGGAGGAGGDAFGGGISNEGTLTIESSKVTGNSAIGGAGGNGGKGGRGGQGADAVPAEVYYGIRIPGKPPGPGGPGGRGGDGGSGGSGNDGGIHSESELFTIAASKTSGNTERDGAAGKKGAVGKQGKLGAKAGSDPYAYSPRRMDVSAS